jgi:hypothetical protein
VRQPAWRQWAVEEDGAGRCGYAGLGGEQRKCKHLGPYGK